MSDAWAGEVPAESATFDVAHGEAADSTAALGSTARQVFTLVLLGEIAWLVTLVYLFFRVLR